MENESIKFLKNIEDNTGFLPDVFIKKEIIGRGAFGTVYKAEIEKGPHRKSFAVKDYRLGSGITERMPEEQIKRFVLRAFSAYEEAKKAGLKVFPTVRISQDHYQLLMSLKENDNYSLLSKGNADDLFSDRDNKRMERVENITNIQELVADIESNLMKASERKIYLPWDSYFFVAEKSNPTHLDFVIGDYDYVADKDYREREYKRKEFFDMNINEAKISLKNLFSSYLKREKKEEFNISVAGLLDKFRVENIDKFNQ